MSKLTLVPTPVGNLGDMTFRAVEVLKAVSVVLAEDTRTSSKLLRHYGIDTPLRAFHQHNEHKVLDRVVEEILSGTEMALVTDAGTPGISDPGFLLVRACVEQHIKVECLPGATAVIPALAVSGLPLDRFYFEGFLPHKKGRQKRLEALTSSNATSVLYESPHRVIKLLEQLSAIAGPDRLVSVSREISKLHEETVRGTVEEVLAHFKANAPRGEFVVVVAGLS
ncbi:MAG: 16S rRNA (cytidine(1402)-2'-O)-methyltransferase [Flavobacteriales bacterium]|nr:16S rRNA (cytidine(1402)-2'-O)-methyltransferase [Flavobacteriales bacterium]MDP4953563.1 16S rRNA (cytidine(1402)-2'-O)-methyltransferase [Flavobacteriales bacterium]